MHFWPPKLHKFAILAFQVWKDHFCPLKFHISFDWIKIKRSHGFAKRGELKGQKKNLWIKHVALTIIVQVSDTNLINQVFFTLPNFRTSSTMIKKFLSKPLSIFLNFTRTRTRTLTSIPQCLSPSPPFAPYHLYHNYDYSSPGSLRFCRKSFCSEPAQKFQPTCWNCHAVPQSAPFLFCQSCRCIQPVDHSNDYFDIFGL